MKQFKRWPMIVIGLLAAHLTLMGWAVAKFVRDPNSQVITNYYEKAVRFDETKEARARQAGQQGVSP